MNTLDRGEASKLAYDALCYMVAGDAEMAADLLTDLGTRADTSMMYGACCGLAEAGKIVLHKIYGEQAPRPGSSDMWVLEQLKPGTLDCDPVKAFSARFLVAYCNGDKDTTRALYETALNAGPDDYVASVCALLGDVAGICRLAIDPKRDGS
jgi:hypothetical protein